MPSPASSAMEAARLPLLIPTPNRTGNAELVADNAPYLFVTTFTRLVPASEGTIGVLVLESDQFPNDHSRVIIVIDGVLVFVQ